MTGVESRLGVTRTLVGYLGGVALGTFCLTLVFLGMRAVMDVGGACADGGPFVSAQPCPDGAPLALTGGILGLFGAGGLMAWFGGRLGPGYVGLVGLGWPALFISLGFNFFQYGFEPAGPATGPEWGFLISGVIFWLMGGVPLAIGLAGWRATRRGTAVPAAVQRWQRVTPSVMRIEFAPNSFGAPRPSASAGRSAVTGSSPGPAAEPVRSEDDLDEALVSQLERLGALHRSGSLTEEEFAAAKARVLANESLDA